MFGDPSPNHFTGLERDAESGLDHTLNRQYPSNLGRWLTPDPAGLMAVRFESPQTWNLYAYVGNNPLTLTDPTGLSAEVHEYCRGNTYCLASFAQSKQAEKTSEANAQDAAQKQTTSSSTTTTVTLNTRPANIPGGRLLHDLGLNHEWISTPAGTDVGMGTAKGVPQSDIPGVETEVVDHTGQVPTSTQTFTGVDKAALRTYTKVGTPTGRWVPGVNDCNTWAQNVIKQSTPHTVVLLIQTPASPAPIPIVLHNVVVYANGSIHSPGGP